MQNRNNMIGWLLSIWIQVTADTNITVARTNDIRNFGKEQNTVQTGLVVTYVKSSSLKSTLIPFQNTEIVVVYAY
jgi:hypothetical protein